MQLLIVIGLPALLYFFFVVGTALISRQLSEGVTAWLRDAGALVRFVGGPAVALSIKLTRWITHNVGAVFYDAERLAVTWFSGLYQYFDLVVTNALEWPLWLWKVQRWLLFHELPALLKQVPHAVTSTVTRVVKRVQVVERTVVKLPKLSKAAAKALIAAAVATYIHPFLAQLRWLRAHFHALTVAIPRALPIPQVPTFPNIWKRIRALERKVAVPLGIAAVAAAIARMGLGWIRCNNVRKAGKAVCGIDPSLLETLLLDTTAIFSILSVVEFAKEMRGIEDEAVSIMGRLVREWPA